MRIILMLLTIVVLAFFIWLFLEYKKDSEYQISISGEILNYNSENIQMPNEVILGLDIGKPGSWENHHVYYVFKIEKDGKFIIKNIKGKRPTIYYRSDEFKYRASFDPVKNNEHIVIEDIFVLKQSKRNYEDEKIVKYIKMY